MTNIKKLIPIFLLFIVVGLAVVATTLGIEGTTSIASNPDEFKVYFSKTLINDIEDNTVIENSQKISFDVELQGINEKYVIKYDVTNASKDYDAKITINCTPSTDYLKVTNTFNSTNLQARTTRTGTLELEKIKSNSSGAKYYTTTCNMTAEPVERTNQGTEEVPDAPPANLYMVGKKITIETENFNIISETDTTVTMFAQYNLNTTYKQSTTYSSVSFSSAAGWEYTPGPKEIDIQVWSTNPKTYVNEYVSFLQEKTGDTTITGNLITLSELGKLGCTIPANYEKGSGGWTCSGSKYRYWLVNEQTSWTSSAAQYPNFGIWLLQSDGNINYGSNNFANGRGIRPTITISKETLDKYL